MNPKYEIHEWIDRYLNGEMNEEEKRAFENELQLDSQLAETVEAQKVATKIVSGDVLIQLKKQMAHDLNEGGYYRGGTGNKALWYYLTGALIAVVGFFYFFSRKDISAEKNSVEISRQEGQRQLISDTLSLSNTNDSKKGIQKVIENSTASKKKDGYWSESQEIKKKQNNCVDSIINFSCQARGTCLQKQDGAIEIDVKTIKSGQAPYRFSIFSQADFNETTILSDLKPGKYQVYMIDAQQCLRRLGVEVEVPELTCANNNLSK